MQPADLALKVVSIGGSSPLNSTLISSQSSGDSLIVVAYQKKINRWLFLDSKSKAVLAEDSI